MVLQGIGERPLVTQSIDPQSKKMKQVEDSVRPKPDVVQLLCVNARTYGVQKNKAFVNAERLQDMVRDGSTKAINLA